jgi:acetyl esterase/lipase
MSHPPFSLPSARLAEIPAALPLHTAEPSDVPELDDGRGPDYLDRYFSQVTAATLTPYLPPADRVTGTAVLICPGGGYHGVAMDKEGHDIARWLNSFGVAGFVLKYRSPNPAVGPRCQPDGPLRDAQRALRRIRSQASAGRINPNRVGILGFSAGGHLAASASTLFADSAEADPALAALSCRPDFTVLVYPVVSFTAAGVFHAGSRHNLLGPKPPAALARRFSCELQVSKETPPAFLVQTGDDAVPVANSLLYYQALHAAGVPAELHVFAEGGHGYGMHQRGLPVDSWPARCREWLERLGTDR